MQSSYGKVFLLTFTLFLTMCLLVLSVTPSRVNADIQPSTVTLTDEYLPSGALVQGNVFPLEGLLTAKNPMTRIRSFILDGNGLTKQFWTVDLNNVTSYSLKGSAIDNAMVVNDLPIGSYELILEISEQPERVTTIRRPFSIYRTAMSRTPTAKGIDVSAHQGLIDWDTVSRHIDFAILRCGYGDDLRNQDDAQWQANADACTRLGIPFGVYIYSYALTDAQALSEAQHVIRMLENYHPSLPVFLDLEDPKTTATLTNADILRHTKIFCGSISNAGYTPGVYTMLSWWNSKLASGKYNQWVRWVAQFSDSNSYGGDCLVWQYSEKGTVAGINGAVDLDYWYGEFPPAQTEQHTHKYTGVITKPASCLEDGEQTFTCSDCGERYTEVLPAIGHDFSSWTEVTAPSCMYEGREMSVCRRCEEIKYRSISALGHRFQDGTCIICGVLQNETQKGDIDDDGIVTSADAVLLARYLVGLTVFSESQQAAADLDEDGILTSADAVMLMRRLVG